MTLEGFEVFKKPTKSRAFSEDPNITIYRNGIIGINPACLNKWARVDTATGDVIENILILWDKKGRRVALQPSTDTRSGYKLRPQKNGTVQLSAKAFFDFYKIALEETLSKTPEFIEADSVLVISLK